MKDKIKEDSLQLTQELCMIFEQRMAELKMTRSELADKMGVHRASISALFRHDFGMSLSSMLKVCEVLELELDIVVRRG